VLEPATIAIDGDELRLAQLACAKLAGMVQGTISVGLIALSHGLPEARGLFEKSFQVMNGFALVLHSVSGRPGDADEILRLRESSREVLVALDDLRQRLLEYLESRAGAAVTLAPARQAACTLCDAIAAYADLIQLDPSRINAVKDVVLQVLDRVGKGNGENEPVAG
jgi:hypothetical protein